MSNQSFSAGRAAQPAFTLTANDILAVENQGNTRFPTIDELSTLLTGNTVIQNITSSYRHTIAVFTGSPGSTGGLLVFSATTEDTDSCWSAGAPTRLVAQAGMTKVRISTNLILTSGSALALQKVQITKNGSTTPIAEASYSAGSGSVYLSSSVLPVSPGDYFEINVVTQGTAVFSLESYFQLEVLEMVA